MSFALKVFSATAKGRQTDASNEKELDVSPSNDCCGKVVVSDSSVGNLQRTIDYVRNHRSIYKQHSHQLVVLQVLHNLGNAIKYGMFTILHIL